MYALIDDIKQQDITVALLSNIDPFIAKMLREFGLYRPFDPCLLSCEIGVDKPNSEAYTILLDRLGLSGEDVLFIDDRAENIAEAKLFGIDAILFESPKQIQQELIKRNLLEDKGM